MTHPSTTQVLALPARSEQYGLFLTPNDWTIEMAKLFAKKNKKKHIRFEYTQHRHVPQSYKSFTSLEAAFISSISDLEETFHH